MEHREEFNKIVLFLDELGIRVTFASLERPTFLPGIDIEGGQLIIDTARLAFPGDILHEAGHIAVVESDKRQQLFGNVEPDSPAESLEMAAILWSYAALRKLDIDPTVVFHSGGYKGQSRWMVDQFNAGVYIGLPLLEWMGMALGETTAELKSEKPFPHMLKWLRD